MAEPVLFPIAEITGRNPVLDLENVEYFHNRLAHDEETQPVELREGTNQLIDGNHRIEAAERAGKTFVRAYFRKLTDEEFAEALAEATAADKHKKIKGPRMVDWFQSAWAESPYADTSLPGTVYTIGKKDKQKARASERGQWILSWCERWNASLGELSGCLRANVSERAAEWRSGSITYPEALGNLAQAKQQNGMAREALRLFRIGDLVPSATATSTDALASLAKWDSSLPRRSRLKADEIKASMEETVQEQVEAEQEALRRRAEKSAYVADLKRLTAVQDSEQRYVDVLRATVPLLDVPRIEHPSYNGNRPTHTWVLVLSDHHMGQKTTAAETGGLFEQTSELTLGQISHLANTVKRLHEIATKSINVPKLVVLQLGDLVEGDGMRQSQATGIDSLVSVQTIREAEALLAFYQEMFLLFEEVEIYNVGGNHDRISQKAGNAGLSELGYHDTFAWLIGEIERMALTSHIAAGRLKLTNAKSFFDGAIIAGKRFVFEHGASVKGGSGSYGGVPWYPITAAALKYANMTGGADFVVMGHYHRGCYIPFTSDGYIIMNGAMPGTTCFVQSRFKTVTTPCQMLVELNDEHGLVDIKPLYLTHSGQPSSSTFWTARRELALPTPGAMQSALDECDDEEEPAA